MKISTKGRYGTRFLLELALRSTDQPVTIKEAAESQHISEKYLEQIIPALKSCGFIRSIRGAQGGYLLNQSPKDITVGMILRSLEGSLAPVDCVLELDCSNIDHCVTIDVWKKVYNAVNQVVDNISLADLVDNYHHKANQK